jgi:hypothetical protein
MTPTRTRERSKIQIECSPIIADFGWHQLEPHVLTRAENLWLLAYHQAALDPAAETRPHSYKSLCLISGLAAYADIEVELFKLENRRTDEFTRL